MSNFGQAYDRWLDDNNPANDDYELAFQEAREQLMNHKYVQGALITKVHSPCGPLLLCQVWSKSVHV